MNTTMTRERISIHNALEWGRLALVPAGFDDPKLEAAAILGGLLNYSSALLHLNGFQEIPAEIFNVYQELLRRRQAFEPVAYLLGKKNFFGRDFLVNPSVLIPRPETELMAELVMDMIADQDMPFPHILDLGTGSGCLGVTLACHFPDSTITATDVSPAALSVARANAQALKVAPRIRFIESNLYAGLGPEFLGDFDMIVSNPPYILSPQLSTLEPDLKYEPTLALDGGTDGLSIIRPLVDGARRFLKPNGSLVLEIGYDLGAEVQALFEAAGFNRVRILKDFGGNDRIAVGENIGSV